MATTTLQPVSPFTLGSYSSNYYTALSGSGLVKASSLWLGQYKNGTNFELSQIFLTFDLSSIPQNSNITSATLRFTVSEVYGQVFLQLRKHTWAADSTAAWAPGGPPLASKELQGQLDMRAGGAGSKSVTVLGLAPGTVNKIVIVCSDMAEALAPTLDDTLLITASSIYLDVVHEPAPTLADLELSNYSVPANAPIGYSVANILNKTSGSALVPNPDMSPKLELVGAEVRTKAALTLGEGLNVSLKEVLAGATGSPKEYGTFIEVVAPIYAEYKGSASGTTTLVLPAHQAGDLLVAFLFRDGSTTAPATPAGWTSGATGTGTTCSYRLVWKIATSNSESPGAATTATSTITSCYRPGPGYTLSLGATAQGNGSSTSLTYQSLSMQKTDGTSTVAAFAGHRSINTTIENPPAGMVLRHTVLDATDEVAAFDTNGGVSTWVAKTVGVGGTSSGWITTTFEIRATIVASGRKAVRFSYWM